MILHTLNASPASAAYRDCLALLAPRDSLVLMGDGVYAALDKTAACDKLCSLDIDIFVLESDARLAGVCIATPGIQLINMDDLVRLTEQFPRQQAWF